VRFPQTHNRQRANCNNNQDADRDNHILSLSTLSNATFHRPIELIPLFQERVWGRRSLAPFYPNRHVIDRIGEVWFTFKENRTKYGQTLGDLLNANPKILGQTFDPAHPNQCPLLAKLLFTSERLSVQVHPRDDYAQEHHQSLGKTEAWYVVSAEPDAEVAVGFKQPITAQRLEESARSGEIETLLDWRPVQAGDTIFVPAGTVHAIGAGATICEIQQNSDITYRLYDYGRARELHLEHGMRVSDLGPYHYRVQPQPLGPGREELVVSDYFRIEKLTVSAPMPIGGGLPYYLLLTCIKGSGEIAGEDFNAGTAWLVPAFSDPFNINGPGSEWILSYTAAGHAKF
jgi:mannose-6-phosphate isomerase